jgi:hypothetical protein
MSKTKTGVFFMGRLPQIFGQAALAASVLAGGASLLNAGGAMAAACTGSNGAHFDITGLYSSCSSPVGTPPVGNEFVTIDTKFSPELPGPTVGKTEFKITSLTNGPFLKVLLDSDFDLPSGTITKTLWADAAYTIPILTASPLVSNSGTPTALIDIVGKPTTIWVRDEFNISAGGQLDNYTNTFQTPGPFPILGAGAAFGFSRKLRSRIKAGRTA